MVTQIAKAGGIEELFGEPENNPNFREDRPFFTGFSIVETESSCIPVSAVLAPCGMDSGYRLVDKQNVIDPAGKKLGFVRPSTSRIPIEFFSDTDGRETGYFRIGNLVYYISDAGLQKLKDDEAKRQKEREGMIFPD